MHVTEESFLRGAIFYTTSQEDVSTFSYLNMFPIFQQLFIELSYSATGVKIAEHKE